MKKAEFGIHENIAKNIVFIDGLARSGKSLVDNIIHTLDRFEHIGTFYLLEHILPGLSMGAINVQYARALIRNSLNVKAYNIRLGRNVNFRCNDRTGVLNYKEPAVFFQRIARVEKGDSIVDELRVSNNYIPFQVHEIMVNLEYFEKLDIDYYMIEIFRNPIDVAYSWWKKGWGERFGNDPRAFTLSLDLDGQRAPWYSADYLEKWLSLNQKERSILNVLRLTESAVEQYKKTTLKARIHLVSFEEFAQRPFQELEKMCSFLGTEQTEYTPHFVNLSRCPRVIDLSERDIKVKTFAGDVDKELLGKLLDMADSYEKNLYGLRKRDE